MYKNIFSKNQQEILKKVSSKVQDFYDSFSKKGTLIGGHDFDHARRVVVMAVVLSKREATDPFLSTIASFLHDLGRCSFDPRARSNLHGELSVKFAKEFLNSINSLSSNDKEMILNAIEDHSKLNKEVRENSVVKILMDADRLDAIGALGPVRAASYRWNLPLYLEQKKVVTDDQNIKSIFDDFAYRIIEWEDMLWTKSAKRIAKPRFSFLRKFIREFKGEIDFVSKVYEDLKFDKF